MQNGEHISSDAVVAPFAGAWIEIILLLPGQDILNVAPFAGAWIEILLISYTQLNRVESLPSRERGLKCVNFCRNLRVYGRSLRGSVD